MKKRAGWYKDIYDEWFTSATIDSKQFHKTAKGEAAFLYKILKLPRGSKILDIPCGAGRHSALLAKKGFNVTALDINKLCLKHAKKNCKNLDVKLDLADMSKLQKYQGKFDAVVNMFTGFGYFPTDKDNKNVLKQLVSALKPGGKLVVHMINRDWILHNYKPVDWRMEKTDFVLDARVYDKKTKYIESQTVVMDKDGKKSKRYYSRMRLYSISEFVTLMKQCGLQNIKVYGDFKGSKFNKIKSYQPIYVGQKI